jgi:hypothetical protein
MRFLDLKTVVNRGPLPMAIMVAHGRGSGTDLHEKA